jgi:hypothetical protein
MAGTLVISNLSDGTNTTSATNAVRGSAKAWVNFDGATGTRNASYNVDSVTVNATGDYTINFTTGALSGSSYSAVGMARAVGASQSGYGATVSFSGATTPSASSLRIWTLIHQNASDVPSNHYLQNTNYICVAVFQ